MAVGRHIGPWAYEAHRAQEYIKKLREFVKMGEPEPATQWSDTAIASCHRVLVGMLINNHAPQLKTTKKFTGLPYPFLDEEHGTRGIPFYHPG
jgi:hypothetical protein